MPLVRRYIATGNASVRVILREPPMEIIISGIIATRSAVMMAAIFKDAVDAILS
jgi:hypothetical protein